MTELYARYSTDELRLDPRLSRTLHACARPADGEVEEGRLMRAAKIPVTVF